MNIRHTLPIFILTLILLLLVACLPAAADPVATLPVVTATSTASVAAPTLISPTTTSTAAPTSISEATVTPQASETPATSSPASPSPTAPTPTATVEPHPTPAAAYIMALVDMDVRGDPRPDGAIVGHMAHGQIARIASANADESWRLLDCPVAAPGIIDHCWVRAGEPHTMPQPDATRIETGDAADTTVESTLDNAQRHYVFHATAGDDITITIASPGNSVLFHLQGLGDGVIYKHMLDGETGWTGRMAQNQDVLLALNGSSGDAYTLTVTINRGEIQAPGPLYPIVDAQSGYLLGGVQNGIWLDAHTYAPYLQDGPRPYSIYTLAGEQGTVSGSPPLPGSPVCDQPVVPLQPAGTQGAIAAVTRWNAAPRLATELPIDNSIYHDAVTALLEENGLDSPEVHIDRILSVDLDGDDVDEVLISASRLSAGTDLPPVAAGDYALLLMRKVKDGVLTTVPLGLDVYPQAVELAYPWRYEVLGLLDLDGDSVLEVIVAAGRYEGRMVTAYQITSAGMQQVLQAGCQQ